MTANSSAGARPTPLMARPVCVLLMIREQGVEALDDAKRLHHSDYLIHKKHCTGKLVGTKWLAPSYKVKISKANIE